MEAIMTITTPLHTDHQLDQLAGQFEHWRQTRTHLSERIPHALWDQTVALTATLPPARVAKQLRVRLADLKKQMEHRQVSAAAVVPRPLGFVAIGFHMILHASAVLFAAHRASRSALLGPSARQMPFSKAETALPTILAWHRSCGVPHEGTVVSPISVACTPHDPELHMVV